MTRFCAGFRKRRERMVGLEYELLGVDRETGRAVPYAGGDASVAHVLARLRDQFGWRQVGEGGGGSSYGAPRLADHARTGRADVELSGRPHVRLADAEVELRGFVRELREVSTPLGIAWLALGTQPITKPDELAIIPKSRYRIMTSYLPRRGSLALWMMRCTAGAQVNLDVESSGEAADMLRLSLWISPVLTAMFANSPVSAGSPNGWMSRRARIWRETDPDRCGLPPRNLEPDGGVRDYADWAMDAPMFFVDRDEDLVDMSGVSFRTFMEVGARGQEPRIEDWDLHLTTVFPEVRLKSYLEFRSIDSNRLELVMGFAALCAGIIYGGEAVHARLTGPLTGWSYDERIAFLEACAREGL
ncbi:MAG: hypothetical protein HC882_08800, partial [Acidobacteria bacterium]|nr:hypothetical protein [Acidobacteriota bacterium]